MRILFITINLPLKEQFLYLVLHCYCITLSSHLKTIPLLFTIISRTVISPMYYLYIQVYINSELGN